MEKVSGRPWSEQERKYNKNRFRASAEVQFPKSKESLLEWSILRKLTFRKGKNVQSSGPKLVSESDSLGLCHCTTTT